MILILVVVLFVIQIIAFYFLALLYMKVTKFDDLEKKQRQLMLEMDNSITAYLSELKDENAKLIRQLDARDHSIRQEEDKKSFEQPLVEKPVKHVKPSPSIDLVSPAVPMSLALKSYQSVNTNPSQSKIDVGSEPIEKDARTIVSEMHDAGRSIEEIAKLLGKGKTEVELILKFR
jgi:hypothetical protein